MQILFHKRNWGVNPGLVLLMNITVTIVEFVSFVLSDTDF